MEEDSFVKVYDFPDALGPKPKADLLVTTMHGEDRGPLMDLVYRNIESLDPEDRRVLIEYLDLEVDSYSHELAIEVIAQLREAEPELLIRYVRLLTQRAVLDGNREDPDEARRKLWLPEHGIWSDLGLIHDDVDLAVQDAVPERAFRHSLDLHTMYPFSPVAPMKSSYQAVQEGRGAVADYNRSYLEAAQNGGMKRPLDVLSEDGRGNPVSNQHWVMSAHGVFQSAGIQVARNVPYNLGNKRIRSKRLLERARESGLVLDVPKDFLVDELPQDGQYRPGLGSAKKIKNLARLIVRSYLEMRVR